VLKIGSSEPMVPSLTEVLTWLPKLRQLIATSARQDSTRAAMIDQVPLTLSTEVAPYLASAR
jgi:hypothetical protein